MKPMKSLLLAPFLALSLCMWNQSAIGQTGETQSVALVLPDISAVGQNIPKKICPVCREQGLKSIIYVVGCRTTLMATHQWYDENGTYHFDDPNRTTCTYRCSNGHEWSE